MKCLLIINPRSGKMKIQNELVYVIQLLNEYGYEVVVEITRYHNHAIELVKSASYFDLIICSGGDGTLNQTVSGVVSSGYKGLVGYIPTGSVNDFASTLKLNKDIIYATSDILMGKAVKLDVGQFNDKYFSYVASCGIFTRVAYETNQDIKNIFGRLAYMFEGMKDLADLKTNHLRIETSDGIYEDDYIFTAICNANRIGGMLKLDQNIVDLSDGLFELLTIKMPRTLIELKDIIKALQTKDYSCDLVEFHSISEAKIYSDKNTSWTLDGEFMEGSEVINIKSLNRVINFIIP